MMTFYNAEEERAAAHFFKAEIECDEYNAAQIAAMDLSHLNKTKQNLTKAAVKRWNKESETKRKWWAKVKKLTGYKRYKMSAQKKPWLKSYLPADAE